MGIKELRDIIEDDLRVVEELIQKAQHRMDGIQKSLNRLEEREDETNQG